jgi:hypothetical protein
LNTNVPKARIRTNFIPVGDSTSVTPPQKVEPDTSNTPPIEPEAQTAEEKGNQAEDIRQDDLQTPPIDAVEESRVGEDDHGDDHVIEGGSGSSITKDNEATPEATEIAVNPAEVVENASSSPVNRPDSLGLASSEAQVVPPSLSRKTEGPSETKSSPSPRAVKRVQKPVISPLPNRTPPSQRALPSQIRTPPQQRKSGPPRTPGTSTSARASTSPSQHSHTKADSKATTPKSERATISRATPHTPTPVSQPRVGSIPKTTSASKTPQVGNSAQITKASPGSPLSNRATRIPSISTATRKLSTPPVQKFTGKPRPRSALGEISPSSNRRIVSNPPRPASSASHTTSPRGNRNSAPHNVARGGRDRQGTDAQLREGKGTIIPSSDYSHLPTFMRPTQASSSKAVSRPVTVNQPAVGKQKSSSSKI